MPHTDEAPRAPSHAEHVSAAPPASPDEGGATATRSEEDRHPVKYFPFARIKHVYKPITKVLADYRSQLECNAPESFPALREAVEGKLCALFEANATHWQTCSFCKPDLDAAIGLYPASFQEEAHDATASALAACAAKAAAAAAAQGAAGHGQNAEGGGVGSGRGAVPPMPAPRKLASSSSDEEISKAFSYVSRVKKRFQSEPHVYKTFLKILDTYQRKFRAKTSRDELLAVLEQVCALFEDHPDLLRNFTFFLPDDVQKQARGRIARALEAYEARLKGRAAAGGSDGAATTMAAPPLAEMPESAPVAAGEAPLAPQAAGSPLAPAAASDGSPPAEADAVKYLEEVKMHTVGRPHVYHAFLGIMKKFRLCSSSVRSCSCWLSLPRLCAPPFLSPTLPPHAFAHTQTRVHTHHQSLRSPPPPRPASAPLTPSSAA